jgi:hypothetical protein
VEDDCHLPRQSGMNRKALGNRPWLESNRIYAQESLKTSEPDEAEVMTANPVVAHESLHLENPRGKKTFSFSLLLKRKLLFAAFGVLLVGVAADALHFAGTRIEDLGLLDRSGLAKPKSDPASAMAVSDVEKIVARDLYLKGRFEWNKRTPDSLNRARDDFT